ncbi:MAG: copper-binding protein, partial [Paracoccaceae bacterium]
MNPFKPTALAAVLFAIIATALPAAAHTGIHITDPYARVIAGNSVVFFRIGNHEDADDTLIAASSPLA